MRSLPTMEFNARHTKLNISKAMLKVRSKFGIFPRAEPIEVIPEFTASDWRESQNLGFDFMSGSDCYGPKLWFACPISHQASAM